MVGRISEMYIELYPLIVILILHFLADFVMQDDKTATKKSKNNLILARHCFMYALPFFWFGWKFVVLAGLSHFAIDYVTSRVTSYLYLKQERHYFFVTIGFDQLLHTLSLIALYVFL